MTPEVGSNEQDSEYYDKEDSLSEWSDDTDSEADM